MEGVKVPLSRILVDARCTTTVVSIRPISSAYLRKAGAGTNLSQMLGLHAGPWLALTSQATRGRYQLSAR
jgi:hypothetical protein